MPAVAAMLFCLGILSSCGGLSGDAVVVRIGDTSIRKAAVDHWIAVIKHKGAFSGFRGEPEGSPRRRALALLISSNWLIGEAARQGVGVSEATIGETLREREREDPGFRKLLRTTGRTLADAKLEMKSELAGEAIREKLAAQASQISRQEVLDYFHANRRQFDTLAERVVDLVENLPSPTAATALVRRIGTGSRFVKLAYHEHVARTPGVLRTPEKARLVSAIFAARPGVLSRPMPLNGSWTVFVVRSSIPPAPQPFAKVQTEVLRTLDVLRQREVASKFDREYIARWRSKTRCSSGYVGPGCPQAHGLLGSYEDPFSLRAHPVLSEQAAG